MRTTLPTSVSGFPEMLPDQRAVEAAVTASLRATFELHGFVGIETRSVEPLEVLLAKGELDHEVYVLQRLREEAERAGTEEAGATGTPGAPEPAGARAGDGARQRGALALHYDLTVPFARYVTENAAHLHFPLRRHQVQKVWRGERPQEGRFREFVQADIDVVDRDRLAPHHDVEMAVVMATALAALPLPRAAVRVNNRRLVEGFHRGLGADDAGAAAVLRAVDKLDKVGEAGVRAALAATAGYDDARADAALALARVGGDADAVRDGVRALGVEHPLLDQGVAELVAVLEGTAGVAAATGGAVRVVADCSIARGLDYYTGTVYETTLAGFETLGSVCSGGRYDALATDGRTTYPGVGISLGLTRLLSALIGAGALSMTRSSPAAVLVAVAAEDERAGCDAVASALRARGVPVEVAPAAARFGKQIRHADRRGIPFVWFPARDGDGGHEVKDIRSGDQVGADPATWSPPAQDLHPRLVAPEAPAAETAGPEVLAPETPAPRSTRPAAPAAGAAPVQPPAESQERP